MTTRAPHDGQKVKSDVRVRPQAEQKRAGMIETRLTLYLRVQEHQLALARTLFAALLLRER